MSPAAGSDGWRYVLDGFAPEEEGMREALCTLGNGVFCTRGAASEAAADGVHYPGTYVAGLYDRQTTHLAGAEVENEDLVNAPNWLPLTLRVGDGPWFAPAEAELLRYVQTLDMRAGELARTVEFRDAEGRTTRLDCVRLVSMAQPNLAAIELTITPLDWSGGVTVRSALDGLVENAGVARYRALEARHLDPVTGERIADDTVAIRVRTRQSGVCLAQAARTRLFAGDAPLPTARETECRPGYAAQEQRFDLHEGQPVRVEKVVALHTAGDRAISECGLAAAEAVSGAPDFAGLRRAHRLAWRRLWDHFDMAVTHHGGEAGTRTTMVTRLHLFHLLQTASPHTMDRDVGVPARGWHGEAYRGHIFWDELFIFPLLNLRMPEITRGLLKYRYHRLPAARRLAAEAGLPGAMYPWQSGSDGREETQRLHLNPRSGRWLPDSSHRQRHVNAAVAYNVWRYYAATGDGEFLSFYGAEMLLEIARMWAGMATPAADGRHDIRGVMGPDEYHDAYPGADEPGLDNNAYTNVMASWTLRRALGLANELSTRRWTELCAALELGEGELERWREVARSLRVPFHDGVISQFEGYGELLEFDWEGYRRTHGDIHRLDRILEAEGDSPNRYKLSKQADVLMLFYLFSAEELTDLFGHLGYDFDPAIIPRTIAYYDARTSHGSTLSRVAHSWVLARSDRGRSWHLFCEALESDIGDLQGGTTAEGIHLGAMAGTVDLLQSCYTGLELRDGVLWLNPCLPDAIRTLSMRLRFQGHELTLLFTHDGIRVDVVAAAGRLVRIGMAGRVHALASGDGYRFAR